MLTLMLRLSTHARSALMIFLAPKSVHLWAYQRQKKVTQIQAFL